MLESKEACEYNVAVNWAKEDPRGQQHSRWEDGHECWAQEMALLGKMAGCLTPGAHSATRHHTSYAGCGGELSSEALPSRTQDLAKGLQYLLYPTPVSRWGKEAQIKMGTFLGFLPCWSQWQNQTRTQCIILFLFHITPSSWMIMKL